jgi:hypothetical protein
MRVESAYSTALTVARGTRWKTSALAIITPMRTLATDRLHLEPQLAAHADEMFVVLSDPAIYEFENQPPPPAGWLRARYARLESRRSADGRDQWLNWVLRLHTGELIGYVQASIFADVGLGITRRRLKLTAGS